MYVCRRRAWEKCLAMAVPGLELLYYPVVLGRHWWEWQLLALSGKDVWCSVRQVNCGGRILTTCNTIFFFLSLPVPPFFSSISSPPLPTFSPTPTLPPLPQPTLPPLPFPISCGCGAMEVTVQTLVYHRQQTNLPFHIRCKKTKPNRKKLSGFLILLSHLMMSVLTGKMFLFSWWITDQAELSLWFIFHPIHALLAASLNFTKEENPPHISLLANNTI